MEKIINVRGTLRSMAIGRDYAIRFRDVRGTSLRQSASLLKEVGMVFHVSKDEDGYLVWREA